MSDTGRIGEFELIARIFAPLAGEGAYGLLDDAAALSPPPGMDLVLTKDALAVGVHFFADDPWDLVARKALRVNLSDLAAKGARPLGYLLALGLPDGWVLADMDRFGAGLAADQAEFGVPLLGGDTIRSPGGLILSVTAVGAVPTGRIVRRGGARVGDVVVVTGTIGDSALGLQLRLDPGLADRIGLADDERAYLLRRYLLPEPRVALANTLCTHASAAMDISDGLIGDISKIAAASGVRIEIDAARIPLSPAARAAVTSESRLQRAVLSGGDDYEIAATLSPDHLAAFLAACEKARISAIPIGRVVEGQGIGVTGGGVFGANLDFGGGNYTHF